MKEYTLQDLRNLPTTEAPTYIIDGLLRTRRGRPSILGGFDHVGKSTLAQQMAKSVAKGEPFLDRATVQGRVLYFQTEESVEDAKADFLNNMPADNQNIVVLHSENPKANFEELKEKLEKYPDTVLVIIETLMDFFGIRDVKDNDECRLLLQKFCDEICKKYPNACFLFLHWMRKTDATEMSKGLMRHRLLGGTAIPAKLDTLIYMHQVSDTDSRRLILAETRKGKNIEATYLRYDPSTQHSELANTVADEKAADKIKISTNARLAKESECISYVCNNQGKPETTAAKGIGGKYTNTLAMLGDLVSRGKLIRVPAGENNAMLLYTSEYPFCYCGKPVSPDFMKEGTCSLECWNTKDKTCAFHLCSKPVIDIYSRGWTGKYCHDTHRRIDGQKQADVAKVDAQLQELQEISL
jgi:hypothetical protein